MSLLSTLQKKLPCHINSKTNLCFLHMDSSQHLLRKAPNIHTFPILTRVPLHYPLISNTQIHCMACKHWSFVIGKSNSYTHSTCIVLLTDVRVYYPSQMVFFPAAHGVLKGLVLATARHLNKTFLFFFSFNNPPTVACCFGR